MDLIIEVLPNYEPKIDINNKEKVDLNIRDLQNKYPNGCICCGNTFYPKKYSSLIAQHFNTQKHKKRCLLPANKLFQEELGINNNIVEAFENKCKENRELKKLNYKYKEELDNINFKYSNLIKLNIKLQERLIQPAKLINLIDL